MRDKWLQPEHVWTGQLPCTAYWVHQKVGGVCLQGTRHSPLQNATMIPGSLTSNLALHLCAASSMPGPSHMRHVCLIQGLQAEFEYLHRSTSPRCVPLNAGTDWHADLHPQLHMKLDFA